jgi:hypothetical protein
MMKIPRQRKKASEVNPDKVISRGATFSKMVRSKISNAGTKACTSLNIHMAIDIEIMATKRMLLSDRESPKNLFKEK